MKLHQAALFVATLAPFLVCLGYAVRLTNRGKAYAGIVCWTVGVAGVFATALIGGPIIFGLFASP